MSWLAPLKAPSQVVCPWTCPAHPHIWGRGGGEGWGSPSLSPVGQLIPGQTNSPLKHPWDSGFSLGSRLTAGPAPAQQGLVSPSAGTWSQVRAPLICTTSGPQPTWSSSFSLFPARLRIPSGRLSGCSWRLASQHSSILPASVSIPCLADLGIQEDPTKESWEQLEAQEDRCASPSARRPGPWVRSPSACPSAPTGGKQQCLLNVTPDSLTSDPAATEVATLLGGP